MTEPQPTPDLVALAPRLAVVEACEAPRRVALREGGSALVAVLGYDAHPGDEVLVINGADEQFVVGVVRSLRAQAEDGARCIEAEGDLELSAGGRVIIDAAGGVEIRTDEDLHVRAARTDIASDEVAFAAKSVRMAALHLLRVVDVAETRAKRLVERSRDAYREVEGLAQTRAGRIRHVAHTTLHVLAKRAFVKGKDGVKLQGDEIHLG